MNRLAEKWIGDLWIWSEDEELFITGDRYLEATISHISYLALLPNPRHADLGTKVIWNLR